MVTVDDCIEAEEIFKEDAGVQRALRERYGINDPNEVACDPWYYGQRYSASLHPCAAHLRTVLRVGGGIQDSTLPSERLSSMHECLLKRVLVDITLWACHSTTCIPAFMPP